MNKKTNKKTRRRIISIVSAACCIMLLSACSMMVLSARGSNDVEPAAWVNGYYVAYQSKMMPPAEIGWQGLTHITIGCLLAVDDSDEDDIPPVLDKRFYQGTETNGMAIAKLVASFAKENDVIPLVQLGGQGNGVDIYNATSPSMMEIFVDELLATVAEIGARGIDINWEGRGTDYDRLLLMTQMLKEKSPDIILTHPTGNYNANYMRPGSTDYQKFMKLKDISPYLDQINIMSYWGCGTTWYGTGWYSGHSSALYPDGFNPVSIQNTLVFLNEEIGIEKGKLGMGMGFYAGCYSNGIYKPGQDEIQSSMMVGGDNSYSLNKLYKSRSYLYAQANDCIKWDAAARCSYISLPEGQANEFSSRYITYESEESILEKGRFCREEGYGGTIIWTINQGYMPEHKNPHFLMDVLREAFIDPGYSTAPSVTIFPNNMWAAPGTTRQLYTLITGTGDRLPEITWNPTDAGTIDGNGLLTAASISGTFEITAKIGNKSISKPATININNEEWLPVLYLFNTLAFWKEVGTAQSYEVTAIYLIYDGKITKLRPKGSTDSYIPTNYYSNMTHILSGERFRLYAENESARIAITDWFTYTSHDEPFPLFTETADSFEYNSQAIKMETTNVMEITQDMLHE